MKLRDRLTVTHCLGVLLNRFIALQFQVAMSDTYEDTTLLRCYQP